ncbi:MAG: transcription termination factor Rho [Chloroflexi bacterium]|nr:MAG: transcription termination factor Rho [Chloroflexota bacterium]TMG71576.1 MAG: transcription termination factor Rho [Chloroflexota bacterium]
MSGTPTASGAATATNGPNGNGGTATATAQRREPPPPQASRKYYTITELNQAKQKELADIAKEFNVEGAAGLPKQDLITRVLQAQTEAQGNIFAQGILEIVEDGFGFLRRRSLLPSPEDVYVGSSQVRRLGLRTGDFVTGQTRPPKDSEKYFSLLRVEAVNGIDPEQAKRRPVFENLVPVFPDEMFDLEIPNANLTQRLINLVNPLGLGQRALIVSPPKAGKTTILKDVANGILGNHPDVHVMVVLVGERPEEVTDFRRSVNAEVFASTFDEPTENHTRVAELALERAKRLVESGRDVVILLDSITRMTRAYNLAVPPSGRTLSGGMDPVALYPPKRFFGAARNIEGGGSLTIIATCLVDTGSRMDDVIYEEFKGTGNSEMILDRKLQERRTFPAINIPSSSTRREEMLLAPDVMRQVVLLRKMLSAVGQIEGTELLIQRLAKTKTNKEFLTAIAKSMEEK